VKTKECVPPTTAQRIMRSADLPQERGAATYIVYNNDEEPLTATLDKRRRQILDLLMQGPVHCASPIRISDIVHNLKREIGLDVETKMFPGDTTIGAGAFDVYFLKSRVHRVQPNQVAA